MSCPPDEDHYCLAVTEREVRMEESVVNKRNNGNREIALDGGRSFVVNIIMGDLMKERGLLTLMEMLEYMSSV